MPNESNMTPTAAAQAEHILACLSPSPSNARIVRTAATMARAFGGTFTALYVHTPDTDQMPPKDRERLRQNIRLAEQLGATVSTAYGDDVPYQIAEYSRLSRVTKIVVGRSSVKQRHLWKRPALTEKLAVLVPELDIHIIPDSAAENRYSVRKSFLAHYVQPSLRDLALTLLILAAATGIGSLFAALRFTEANIITVYLLGVLVTALFAASPLCSLIASLGSVLAFNFFFTEPRLTLHAYESGYPVTFGIMLAATLMTGTLANRLKRNAQQSAQAAFRTNILFDTNQLLQQAGSDDEMLRITASQLLKLLDRTIIAYPESDGDLSAAQYFTSEHAAAVDWSNDAIERQTAQWVFAHKKRAGAATDQNSTARGQYLAIRGSKDAYGVIGIDLNGSPLDSFENSILLSILGECALAIENSRNARAKEQAALVAKNEQVRANLLRAISHDLRTPLTSIAGNAGYLLSDYQKLDEDTRVRAFTDIYDDALWLTSLVENLLSVTRLEEGRMQLHITMELVEEVIEEALRHINRHSKEHHITVTCPDPLLMARMDATLIAQVIINLVDNAIKYTPVGSTIEIKARRQQDLVEISVCDDGPGVPDARKEQVFEMFFTGGGQVADGHRSMGLGLALCRSILHIHGGEISLTDNSPRGCCFTFTLPYSEVTIHA